MKKELLLTTIMISGLNIRSQCVNNEANVFAFIVNNVPYEIVKEKKNWVQASACAVARGGKLTEINSKQEQDTVFYYLNQAGINAANTIAPDGGGASYVWIGGNDLAFEGKWIWDGDNMGSTSQFWQGASSGSPVGGLYNNWGNEPDDWNGQDGLGMAVTNWPLGLAGQWNDVDEINTLYYIIEYPEQVTTALPEVKVSDGFLFPNPAEDKIFVKQDRIKGDSMYKIIDSSGNICLEGALRAGSTEINITGLLPGIYSVLFEDGKTYRLVKNQ